MILLDTNYLIDLAGGFYETGRLVDDWAAQGENIVTSAVAWGEFLSSGKGAARVAMIRAVLADQILPFGAPESEYAGRLARETGSSRGHRWDTFIAATAIVADARMATSNRRDFQRFVPFGLKLA